MHIVKGEMHFKNHKNGYMSHGVRKWFCMPGGKKCNKDRTKLKLIFLSFVYIYLLILAILGAKD